MKTFIAITFGLFLSLQYAHSQELTGSWESGYKDSPGILVLSDDGTFIETSTGTGSTVSGIWTEESGWVQLYYDIEGNPSFWFRVDKTPEGIPALYPQTPLEAYVHGWAWKKAGK